MPTNRTYTTRDGHIVTFAHKVPATWIADTLNACMIYWTTSEKERTGGVYGPVALLVKAHSRLSEESPEAKQLIVLGTLKLFLHNAVMMGYVMINRDIVAWGVPLVEDACKLANIPMITNKRQIMSNIVLNHLLKDQVDLWAVVGTVFQLAGDDIGTELLKALGVSQPVSA